MAKRIRNPITGKLSTAYNVRRSLAKVERERKAAAKALRSALRTVERSANRTTKSAAAQRARDAKRVAASAERLVSRVAKALAKVEQPKRRRPKAPKSAAVRKSVKRVGVVAKPAVAVVPSKRRKPVPPMSFGEPNAQSFVFALSYTKGRKGTSGVAVEFHFTSVRPLTMQQAQLELVRFVEGQPSALRAQVVDWSGVGTDAERTGRGRRVSEGPQAARDAQGFADLVRYAVNTRELEVRPVKPDTL